MPITSKKIFIHTFEGKFIKAFVPIFMYKATSFDKLLPQNTPMISMIEFGL